MRFGLRELIFMIVLLAVPVASWWYVFKPRNADIVQARMEIIIKQDKLDKLREVAKRIDDIGLAIERGRDAIELILIRRIASERLDGYTLETSLEIMDVLPDPTQRREPS